jgi:glutamine synthetase
MMTGVDLKGLKDLSWVRLSFVDVFGAAHSVQLPASRFERAVVEGEPFDGSALEGRARHLEADMLLRPDPETLVRMRDGLARAVCTVWSPDGTRWPGDPRTALALVCEQVGELASGYRVSAELEFYLLDQAGAPVDRGGYFDEAESPGVVAARAAAERLAGYAVAVDACHHEAGPGQYELDLASLGPMAMADALVLARQVIREQAVALGLRATFMPRPLDGEPGSGLHLHQRVDGRLLDPSGKLDDDGLAFVAGQLAHARGLSALAAPTVNSYKRLHSGPEAPSAAVWAHVNRGALLRVTSSWGGAPSIEFRGADPLANPYLLIAGLLAAAADGLESGLELGPPVEEDFQGFDPASMDSSRLVPLPRDLDMALDALLADDVLVDAFDQVLLSRLVDGRRAEIEQYWSRVTPWELERYFDEA